MRILMVNKYLYPRAGAEAYMLSVASALKERGHDVHFFGRAHPRDQELENSYRLPHIELGSQSGRCHQMKEVVKLGYAEFLGQSRAFLQEIISKIQPDIIHAHNVYNQLPPHLFKGVSKSLPVVMTVHDYKVVCPNYSLFVDNKTCKKCIGGKYFQAIRHRCSQKRLIPSIVSSLGSYYTRAKGSYWTDYRRFLCPSNFMAERLREDGIPPDKISVLPNFTEPGLDQAGDKQGILYVGRLSKEKGVDVLLRAYAMWKGVKPQLKIAGSGPYEEELKEMASSLGIAGVTWLGHIPKESVRAYMRSSAVMVVPSLWHENCSISILEGLSEGTPIITTRQGGNPELIRNGIEGYLYEADQEVSLLGAMKAFFSSETKQIEMGRNARERAEDQYSPSQHLGRLIGHYEQLVSS